MVFHYLIRCLADPGLLKEMADTSLSEAREEALTREIDNAQSLAKRLESKRDRLLDLYGDGLIDQEALYKKVKDLERRLAAARKRIRDGSQEVLGIKAGRERTDKIWEALERLRPFGEELSKKAEKMDFEDKRAFVGLFFGESKVIVHGVKESGEKRNGRKRIPIITFEGCFDLQRLERIARETGAGKKLVQVAGELISQLDESSRLSFPLSVLRKR